MSLKEFEKKMEEQEGLYLLNLAVDEEREYYLKSVGGEEYLKNNFPLMYESYIRSWEADRDEPEDQKDTDDVHFEVYDIMSVINGEAASNVENISDKYSLAVSITGDFLDTNTVLTAPVPANTFNVSINGKIYDPDSPRMPYVEIHESFQQVNKIDRQYLSEELYHKEEFWDRMLKAKFTISVYDNQNRNRTYVYANTMRFGNPMNYAIDNIRFDAPVSSHPETNEIRILYARSAQNLSQPDYIYKSNAPESNGGIMWTIVPVSGEVTLKNIHSSEDYYSFEKLSRAEEGEAMERSTLQYDSKEWKIYRNDLKDDALYAELSDGEHFKVTTGRDNAEVLEFDLFNSRFNKEEDRRYDWVHDIDKASTDNRERICYLVGGFGYDICKKNGKGEIIEAGIEYQIQCRSIAREDLPKDRQYYTFKEGSGTIYIPPIHLWWGCHAKDSRIRMADGSCKRADEIKIGDRLAAYPDKALVVNNIYYGHEAQLVCVKTDAGHRVCVSKGHPLLKEDGTGIDAIRLSAGDRLISESGGIETVSSVEMVPYEDMVYNFTFEEEEEGNYIIADGLYSGDFYAQNKCSNRKEVPTEEQKALIQELAAFSGCAAGR